MKAQPLPQPPRPVAFFHVGQNRFALRVRLPDQGTDQISANPSACLLPEERDIQQHEVVRASIDVDIAHPGVFDQYQVEIRIRILLPILGLLSPELHFHELSRLLWLETGRLKLPGACVGKYVKYEGLIIGTEGAKSDVVAHSTD